MRLFGFSESLTSCLCLRLGRCTQIYNKTVRRFFFAIFPASNYLTSFLRCGLLSESVGVVGLNTASKNEMEMTEEKLKMMEK